VGTQLQLSATLRNCNCLNSAKGCPRTDQPNRLSAEQLATALVAVLRGRDIAGLPLKLLRREVEAHLGLAHGSLYERSAELRTIATSQVKGASDAVRNFT
jgi:hypothetical protein